MTKDEYIKRVKTLLNDIEWTDLHSEDCPDNAPTACPWCFELRDWDKHHVVHDPSCELDLLRKEEPE